MFFLDCGIKCTDAMAALISYYFIVPLLSVLFFVFYVKWKQNYWANYGLREYKGAFFFGSIIGYVKGKRMLGAIIAEMYNLAKSANEKHIGGYFYLTPVYVPVDLTIIKNIILKDFNHFTSHGEFNHPKDILSMNLFNAEGEAWKELRQKLTPTFTSGKMKMMLEKILEKAKDLERIVMDDYVSKTEPLNIKDVLARFTTDIIGSCAFGIECNSMDDPNNEFRYYGVKISTSAPLRLLLLFPRSVLGNLGFKLFGREVSNFYSRIVKDVIKYREENNIIRNDFMELLLELKNKGAYYENKKMFLTENEIIAQCFIFFFGGFETSSTTMTFALFALAENEDIQNKLRENINEVLKKYDGKVTYDAIMEMDYLDKVINETLRRYPPGTTLPRICNKTYRVPGTNVIIKKGSRVRIPVWAIHNDPEYYPNPEVFDPERFNKENIKKRPDFTFLPFGDGPRMCIGFRFGVLQTKVGLISLIKNFKFTVNKMTKCPLEYDPRSFVLSSKTDIWLNVEKI